MMMHTTLADLRSLKLDGLVTGREEQLAQPGMGALRFGTARRPSRTSTHAATCQIGRAHV